MPFACNSPITSAALPLISNVRFIARMMVAVESGCVAACWKRENASARPWSARTMLPAKHRAKCSRTAVVRALDSSGVTSWVGAIE